MPRESVHIMLTSVMIQSNDFLSHFILSSSQIHNLEFLSLSDMIVHGRCTK